MPYRTTPLVSSQYYHVYNRGVARQPVFTGARAYDRFLATLSYYRFADVPMKFSNFLTQARERREALFRELEKAGKPLVNVLCFVLMPNHFHLLLKQRVESGISTFVSRTCNSFTKYINTKHKRVGPLFQGPFKAVRVETDEQLLHLSRYIHLNPVVSFVVKEGELFSYPWSSLHQYLKGTLSWITVEPILNHFKSSGSYQQFVLNQVEYGKTLERIKHLVLEKE